MPQLRQQSQPPQQTQQRRLFIGARAALVAGLIVGIVVVGSQLFISAIYSERDSRALVAAMAGPAGTLSSSIITGLATILALMLTMLSLSQNLNQHLSAAFYTRIKRIAVVAIADMIAGIVLLLILSSPIQTATQQSRQASRLEVTLTYYALIALSGIVAGLFVAVIVMLYNAVSTVVEVIRPDRFNDEG